VCECVSRLSCLWYMYNDIWYKHKKAHRECRVVNTFEQQSFVKDVTELVRHRYVGPLLTTLSTVFENQHKCTSAKHIKQRSITHTTFLLHDSCRDYCMTLELKKLTQNRSYTCVLRKCPNHPTISREMRLRFDIADVSEDEQSAVISEKSISAA